MQVQRAPPKLERSPSKRPAARLQAAGGERHIEPT